MATCSPTRSVAKSFTSDILAGKTVRLIGEAPWLADSGIPFTDDGELVIPVSACIGPA